MGRYDLGLTDREFWTLTLRDFDALVDRREASLRFENLRSAVICCVVANLFRGKNSRPYKPGDFLPCPEVENRQQTPEEMLEVVKQWQTYFEVVK
jgi:hypothetical protein